MSEIKYAYEKLMQEKNLSVNDLPEDAKVGITILKDTSFQAIINAKIIVFLIFFFIITP